MGMVLFIHMHLSACSSNSLPHISPVVCRDFGNTFGLIPQNAGLLTSDGKVQLFFSKTPQHLHIKGPQSPTLICSRLTFYLSMQKGYGIKTNASLSQWVSLGDVGQACITIPGNCTGGSSIAMWIKLDVLWPSEREAFITTFAKPPFTKTAGFFMKYYEFSPGELKLE